MARCQSADGADGADWALAADWALWALAADRGDCADCADWGVAGLTGLVAVTGLIGEPGVSVVGAVVALATEPAVTVVIDVLFCTAAGDGEAAWVLGAVLVRASGTGPVVPSPTVTAEETTLSAGPSNVPCAAATVVPSATAPSAPLTIQTLRAFMSSSSFVTRTVGPG
ncbi:hypothetical protein MWU57_15880 [Isoptericola sp. S6320L]|uniref:hypothetical protein n=1 Tax=Isoptericola sp. S6320L TaxID=2926411 RepID=UPI001FF1D66C|nr:hypothetical protein [Isoptericola sp. S6320L]MCK0118508.1 hypothetical protein [Isoptericola sp. S6320L]